MYEKTDMETSDIVQIVSVCATVLGLIVSEIMALCPGVKANGLLHWLSLYVSKNRDLQITLPHEPSQTTFELRRRPTIHGDQVRISNTPTSQRIVEHDLQTQRPDDVSGSNQ